MSNETTTADGGVRKKGKLGQRIAYACGNLGQSAFYNAMSTYFIVYVTGCLFSGVDKALAAKLIGVITSLVVIIRIAEIFIDPLLGNLIDNAKAQAEAEVNVKASEAEADFRRINGLGPKDRIPPKLRGAYNAIAKKDELKRRATRLTRDVLDRALNSVASIYRDVAVLQNNAEDAVGLINLENRSAITELSVRLDRTGAVRRLEDIATVRRRLNGNGNPVLVFEALFCALIP